jgi:hypothetical protein
MPCEVKCQWAWRPVVTPYGIQHKYAYGYDTIWTPYVPARPPTAEELKLITDGYAIIAAYLTKQYLNIKQWIQLCWRIWSPSPVKDDKLFS